MTSTARAEVVVDLDAIAANTALLRERVDRPLMAVVKADGYGHGLVPSARAVLAGGADAALPDRLPLLRAILDESLRLYPPAPRFDREAIAADRLGEHEVRPGDLVAVPGTGAYCRSLASNYNHVPRPPVVAVASGVARVILRRETEDDLLRMDVS